MNIEHLMDLSEDKALPMLRLKTVQLLLTVINDWPENVNTTAELIASVRSLLGSPEILGDIVKEKISELSILRDAWTMEALQGILDILSINNANSLEKALNLHDLR
jgi:hypothetical protein